MERINNLIKHLDNVFWEQKAHIKNGTITDYYDGLVFDYYFNRSIYSIDYIDVYDYFLVIANVNINEKELLANQIPNWTFESKIKFLNGVINLLCKSSYYEKSDKLVEKIVSILQQCGMYVVKNGDEYIVYIEKIKFSGSYCDIVELSPTCYKKRLQKQYISIPQWPLRMKTEFDNLQKLKESKYVLNAYTFNENDSSFTMEVCESNLGDDLEKLTDEEAETAIHDILLGMKDVHAEGILHRDLHLGNILKRGENYVLSDFGLSKDTMIRNDFKSSNTPKTSNFFMDPAAKDDFSKLDKLTDIYSVGKIIEYVVSSRQIRDKYSLIIKKATDVNREKRYQNISDILSDFESVIDGSRKKKDRESIITDITNGRYNIDVHHFVNSLVEQDNLSTFLVSNKCYNFAETLLQFTDDEQMKICESINKTFVDATGYGGWDNYDIFGCISSNIIEKSKCLEIRKLAINILKICSDYRFTYYDVFKNFKLQYPELF